MDVMAIHDEQQTEIKTLRTKLKQADLENANVMAAVKELQQSLTGKAFKPRILFRTSCDLRLKQARLKFILELQFSSRFLQNYRPNSRAKCFQQIWLR